MESMENIEMRDFAVQAVIEADPSASLKRRTSFSEWSARSFWEKHIRITIHEEECRDHVALERTYLAYVRTASAYAQFGVTMAQLFRLNVNGEEQPTTITLRIGSALGATTEAIAILVILIGAGYFAKQQSGIMKGHILARGWDVPTIVSMTFVVSHTFPLCAVNPLIGGIAVRHYLGPPCISE